MGMKVIMEMDQAKLEEIIQDFVTKRGLQLAKVDKAIQWKTRRGLAAVVQIEEPDEQEKAVPALATAPQRSKPQRASRGASDGKLHPEMFPDPIAAAALLEAEAQEAESATDSPDEESVIYPGETPQRTQEVRTLADLIKSGSGPKRGAGR